MHVQHNHRVILVPSPLMQGLVDFSFGFGLVIGRLLGVGLYAVSIIIIVVW